VLLYHENDAREASQEYTKFSCLTREKLFSAQTLLKILINRASRVRLVVIGDGVRGLTRVNVTVHFVITAH